MAKKVEYGSRIYNKRAIELAVGYCPSIHQCNNCGNPYIKGYCCDFCGSIEPYKPQNIKE